MPCGSKEVLVGVVEIKRLCFMWLSSLFKGVQRGFPGFAESQIKFLVHILWVHFQFNGFRD